MDFLSTHSRKTKWILALALSVAGAGLGLALWGGAYGLTCGIPCMSLVLLSLYSRNSAAPVTAAAFACMIAIVSYAQGGAMPDLMLTLLGVVLGAIFCVRRVRSHGQTRLRAQFSQSIVDALSSQVAVLDAAGVVAAVNEAWRRQTVSKESPLHGCVLGSNFLMCCPKTTQAEHCESREGLANRVSAVLSCGSDPSLEVEYAFGDDPKRWYVLRVSRFVERDTVWAVVEQEEITARKQAELEAERGRSVYRELATRDQLTGLYNRRALDQLLAEEIGRYERYGNRVAVAMADIDHFKRVNDEHGHVVGDAALQWLADLLAKNVRVVDKVTRYGGEEFAIIAPELSAAEACGLAERLRGMIVSHPFRYTRPDGTSLQLPITVSFGVASIPGDVESGAAIIQAADKALYAAKRCGRNCTVQFRELEEPLVS